MPGQLLEEKGYLLSIREIRKTTVIEFFPPTIFILKPAMEQLASVSDTDRIAEEFAMLAKQKGGESPQGFVFNRED